MIENHNQIIKSCKKLINTGEDYINTGNLDKGEIYYKKGIDNLEEYLFNFNIKDLKNTDDENELFDLFVIYRLLYSNYAKITTINDYENGYELDQFILNKIDSKWKISLIRCFEYNIKSKQYHNAKYYLRKIKDLSTTEYNELYKKLKNLKI